MGRGFSAVRVFRWLSASATAMSSIWSADIPVRFGFGGQECPPSRIHFFVSSSKGAILGEEIRELWSADNGLDCPRPQVDAIGRNAPEISDSVQLSPASFLARFNPSRDRQGVNECLPARAETVYKREARCRSDRGIVSGEDVR